MLFILLLFSDEVCTMETATRESEDTDQRALDQRNQMHLISRPEEIRTLRTKVSLSNLKRRRYS